MTSLTLFFPILSFIRFASLEYSISRKEHTPPTCKQFRHRSASVPSPQSRLSASREDEQSNSRTQDSKSLLRGHRFERLPKGGRPINPISLFFHLFSLLSFLLLTHGKDLRSIRRSDRRIISSLTNSSTFVFFPSPHSSSPYSSSLHLVRCIG